METTQIIVDATAGKATVATLKNGIPVPPAKTLEFSSLSEEDKLKVEEAISIIELHAK